jgi:hypothetical protein
MFHEGSDRLLQGGRSTRLQHRSTSWRSGESRADAKRSRRKPEADVAGWEEVKNPQGVEGTLRSRFQARSDRYPGPPRCGLERRKVRRHVAKADEGRAQAQRSSWHTSEGKRSREHRPGCRVMPVFQERTLRWIKALKSTPWLARGRCGSPLGGEERIGRKPRDNPLDGMGRSPTPANQRKLDDR